MSAQQNSLSTKNSSILVSDESFMENQKPAEVAHKSGLYCSKIDEEENTKEELLLPTKYLCTTYEWPKLIGWKIGQKIGYFSFFNVFFCRKGVKTSMINWK